MFAEKIGESCSTTGTGTFSLGGAYGNFRAWGTGFATGTDAFYLATNDAGTIWEIGYGTFTDSTPDTLSRTLVASSSGSLINWVTTPYRVYSVPSATAMKHMLAPLVNGVANVPLWLPAGGTWLDYVLGAAVSWVKKRYISGTRTLAASHAEEGRFHLTGGINIFAASQRALFVDKGAASYTSTADDVGKVLAFDCTASARVLTMLANSASGMGHGAYVFVYPYGSASNGVTFTPGGADTAQLTRAPPNRLTKFMWDGARNTWVSNYSPPQVRSALAGLTLSAAGSTATYGIAAGQAADSTNGDLMELASAYTKGTGAWAVGSGSGSLDTGAIATSTWYHAWLIKRPDTGVVDALISLSATTPTMPTGYTLKRRIGSMKTDGSSQWVAFIQDGDLFQWKAVVADVSANAPGTAAVTRTLTVPPGVNVVARTVLDLVSVSATTPCYAALTDLATNDADLAQTAAVMNAAGYVNEDRNQIDVRTTTSAQIRSRVGGLGDANVSISILTYGWIDRRGRDE